MILVKRTNLSRDLGTDSLPVFIAEDVAGVNSQVPTNISIA